MTDPHRARVALQVSEIIRCACGGVWPATARAARSLLRRYGLALRLLSPGDLPDGPYLRGRIIYAECPPCGDPDALLPVLLHEVAEYLLRGEEEPPYRMGDTTRDEYHECARLIETLGHCPQRLLDMAEGRP